MYRRCPLYLLQGTDHNVALGGVWTAGNKGGLALVRRLQARVAPGSEWTARRKSRRRQPPLSLVFSVFLICLFVRVCLE